MPLLCAQCQRPRLQWGPLLAPHRCIGVVQKAAPIFDDPAVSLVRWGIDTSWATQVYAEYYATSPLVYSAVKLRADAVARPRLKVWTTSADGTEQAALEDHPLQLLLDKANDWWSASELWRATETNINLFGSAFWTLEREGIGGLPSQIWIARPDRMRVVADKTKYVKGFIYGGVTEGSGKFYPAEDVIWFRLFNPLDEFAGLSPVAPGRLSIDMAADAAVHNRNAFRNGVLADTVITTKGVSATQEEVDALWLRLKKKFAGPDNSHKPMVLGTDMDAKSMAMSSRDMEFMASLRWSLEDVCRIYGVPKTLLHDLERATYSNIATEEHLFWRNTIAPQLMFFESVVNEFLVPQFGQEGVFVQFDLTDIEAMQEDEVEIATMEREDVKVGILTINEVRERRGLEPVPWGDEPPTPALPFGAEQSPGDGKPPRPTQSPGGKSHVITASYQPLSLPAGDYRRWKPPEQTDAWLQNHWEQFSKRFDQQNQRFDQMQRRLFEAQFRDIIRRLRSAGALAGLTIFNPANWIDQFISQGREPLVAALVSNANAQIDAYSLGVSFNLKLPVVQEWLDSRLGFWARTVNEETGRLLTQELQAGMEVGESIPTIQKRVEKVFNFNDTIRSERIARTEVLAGSNRGALEAYRQSGVVERKRWLATRDDRVRDAHAEANGQTVALEAPFLVMDESIMAPGEGSPGNSINCRCTIVPVLERSRMYLAIANNGHSKTEDS